MTFSQFLSLLSVLGGGVVSAIFVSYLTSRRDLKDYKRKKYEELYEIIRTDGISFFDWWIRYQAAFEGSITLNDAQKSPESITDGPDRKTKAEMLANLYAPKIISPLQDYWKSKQSFVLLINEMVKEKQSATSSINSSSIDNFHNARTKVEQARQKLLDDIAIQSGKL